ncbi:hypothetical protein HYDPIDRAFT_28101 [Hydnomerulius pinastri MD-312]|uniref:CFEM domain-containing protein n=1 Tax=Hydnomerulius pinastri MD-312 TaxID=994086 RepID=A0A0C9VGP5_9AGAM|nr:hypothetical protein HYDPIDRAFT_28101 [Hydnomerulius pinastri MD-312]
MRFSVALVALTAAVSSASAALIARQSLPNCAAPCLANADFGGCAQDDDTCLCNNQAFISSTTSCIQSSCTGNDLATAESFAQQLCLAVGVTLSAGTTTPSATGSPSPSPSTGAAMSNSINMFAGAAAAVALAAVF